MSTYLSANVLPALRGKRDEELLEELVRRWGNQKLMNKWMKMFFMCGGAPVARLRPALPRIRPLHRYLDRFYVNHHSLPSLTESGIRKFKDIVYGLDDIDPSVRASPLLAPPRRRGRSYLSMQNVPAAPTTRMTRRAGTTP